MRLLDAFIAATFAACQPSSASSLSPQPPTSVQVEASPSPPAGDKEGDRPLDTSCNLDDECDITTAVLSGPEKCCPGCVQHAANRQAIAHFRAACEKSVPVACPPIGCPVPNLKPKCISGQCSTAR